MMMTFYSVGWLLQHYAACFVEDESGDDVCHVSISIMYICRPFLPPTTTTTTTTARPVITTYRPVPDYLSSSTSKAAIADIIADLLVEHIENTADSEGKTKDKRFLDLLSALSSLEGDNDSPPLPPGPPYLPPHRLPANSVTRPPSYLFHTVSPPPPPPPKRIHQNNFQTNFNKNNFQETGLIKPFIKGLNNSKKKQKKKVSSLDSMLQNLLSNEVNPGYLDTLPQSPPPKRAPAFYPYPQQFQNTRVPVQTLPERKPAKKSSSRYPIKQVNKKESSSSDFSRYPLKPAKKKESSSSAFSRYPIKIPQIKQNQHFSLPIDSLADLRRQNSEDLNGRNSLISDEEDFVSFSDQLRLMLEDLGGSRRP